MIVVDATVAFRWTMELPLSEEAEALLRVEELIIAPDLIVAEITNAFATAARRVPSVVARVRDGLEFLPRWFAELVPVMSLRADALELALELKHPAYDCFYLALASQRQCRLVTTDERLIRKVAGTSHASRITHLRNWTHP